MEKFALTDTEEPKEPVPKRLCDHSVYESWGDNDTELIHHTPGTTIEGNTQQAKATPPPNIRESHPRASKNR
jgi:hypothetical protein